MESRQPYEVSIELHSGGVLHLALSDQDKISIIRAFILSLPIEGRKVLEFLEHLGDFEQKSKPIDIWKLKLDSIRREK
jgi:hypothetical protein